MTLARVGFLLATLVGLALAAWALRSVDLAAVSALARRLGWAGALAYLTYSVGLFVLLGGAWLAVARGEPVRRLPLFTWARLVREAVAELLPWSQLGGLVFGARTLARAGVPGPRLYASMTADMMTEMASQFLFTLFGMAMTASLLFGGGGAALRPTVVAGAAVLAALLGIVVNQRRLLALAARAAHRLIPAAGRAIAEVEAELARIYAEPRRVAASFALNLAGWVASGAGTWLLLRLIGAPLPLVWALAIEALISTVRSAAFAVPGALGFQEAAYVMLGPVFGLPAETAVAVSLAKRARDVAVSVPVLLTWHLLDGRADPDRSTSRAGGRTAAREPESRA